MAASFLRNASKAAACRLSPAAACRLSPAAACRLSPAAACRLSPSAACRLSPATVCRLMTGGPGGPPLVPISPSANSVSTSPSTDLVTIPPVPPVLPAELSKDFARIVRRLTGILVSGGFMLILTLSFFAYEQYNGRRTEEKMKSILESVQGVAKHLDKLFDDLNARVSKGINAIAHLLLVDLQRIVRQERIKLQDEIIAAFRKDIELVRQQIKLDFEASIRQEQAVAAAKQEAIAAKLEATAARDELAAWKSSSWIARLFGR